MPPRQPAGRRRCFTKILLDFSVVHDYNTTIRTEPAREGSGFDDDFQGEGS